MKSFSRVQKKGILSARAIENNRLNNSAENFDEMVEKQLEDDFKVHEYLNENPNQGHNSEEYIALFNTLLVKKFTKIKRKELLKSTKAQSEKTDRSLCDQSRSKSQVKGQTVDTYYTEEQYLKIKEESEAQQQVIEEKTQQELEMKRVLLKQITENKKSLNLLKGDIGHMIARNQSISVLESKVNKVSLVSQNQLKRVSLALSKDKEQVQLRQEMQKRFHNKLKVVENVQNRNLKKIKLSYIETMKRRKQIFDNLSLIEKECASIEEYSDKLKQKEEKNAKTLGLFRLLNFVKDAIQKCGELWLLFEEKFITSQDYCKTLMEVFDYETEISKNNSIQNQLSIDEITPQKLENLMTVIITEFKRNQKQIQQKKKVYKECMSNIEEEWTKICQCDLKQNEIIQEFNKEERNQLEISHFSTSLYFQAFHQLKSNYNVFYFLIDFFERKFNNFSGKELVNRIFENECFHLKIQSNQQEVSGLNEDLFTLLQLKFKTVLESIHRKLAAWRSLPENITSQWVQKNVIKKPVTSNMCTERDCDNLSQKDEDGEYQSNSEPEDGDRKLISQLNLDQEKSIAKSITRGTKKTASHSKHVKEEEVAKRIQILTKIDQSYYRMIKETIEMQKENTMKNYQFQRSFKRNKYSSQDELLEQKRFEATFSSLFKQDPDDTTRPPKLKHQSFKIKKALNNKSAFASVHNTKSKLLVNTTATQFCKTNSTFWERQKKLRLRNKLKDVLSRT